jgi:hypothetical protein
VNAGKYLMMVLEVLVGAVGVKLLAPKLASTLGTTEQNATTGIVAALIGLGLFSHGGYSKDLLLLALGAVTPTAQAKILAMLPVSVGGQQGQVAGTPFIVGAMPSGQTMWALPHSYHSAGFPVS